MMMKIIAFEGLDKSGKATQSKLLANYLESEGYKVEHSEFHRYDTPTGKLIQDWLYGRYKVSQRTIELIMTADKQAQQEWFKQLEKNETDFLVLDRYTTSQLVYSQCNGISKQWTEELQNFLWLPHFEFFIDVPVSVSMKRKGQHGDNDRYESNKDLLTKVRKGYLSHFLADIRGRHIIDGMQSIENVHSDIVETIKPYLWR